MDSGSGEAGSLAVTGSLKRLSKETGVDFPRIFEARRRTEEALEDRRRKLATLRADDDVAVVLMGSWGRGELTSGSDDDFMLLIDGESRESVHPTIDEIWEALGAEGRPPGREEVFGVPTHPTSRRSIALGTVRSGAFAMPSSEPRGRCSSQAASCRCSSVISSAKRPSPTI